MAAHVTFCRVGSDTCAHLPSAKATDGPTLECRHLDSNPSADYTFGHFDNFHEAVFVMLQAVTLNGWHVPMLSLLQARPELAPFTLIYFNLAAVVGGFFIFNLFVAVIFDEVLRSVEYMRSLELAEAAQHSQQQLHRSTRGLGSEPSQSPCDMLTVQGDGVKTDGVNADGIDEDGIAVSDQSTSPKAPMKQHSMVEEASDCCGFQSPLKLIGQMAGESSTATPTHHHRCTTDAPMRRCHAHTAYAPQEHFYGLSVRIVLCCRLFDHGSDCHQCGHHVRTISGYEQRV